MKIRVEHPSARSDTAILRLYGKLTIGDGDIKLRDVSQREIEDGRTRLILDLSKTSTIDSNGFGELGYLLSRVARESGSLSLVEPSHKVQEVLQMTQLSQVFDVFPNDADALAAIEKEIPSKVDRLRAQRKPVG